MQALTWGLITGFESPFPWFYAAFFAPMIIHRAWRDVQRCREKYGEAWTEYERQVPYLFIPVRSKSFLLLSAGLHFVVCVLRYPSLYKQHSCSYSILDCIIETYIILSEMTPTLRPQMKVSERVNILP